MIVHHFVADFITVWQAFDAAVIARGQDGLVLDDDGTHVLAVAGGTSSYFRRDIHEICFPANAFFFHSSHGLFAERIPIFTKNILNK
jgi:hypothetical protein